MMERDDAVVRQVQAYNARDLEGFLVLVLVVAAKREVHVSAVGNLIE